MRTKALFVSILGGTVEIPGTVPLQEVLLQVRVWVTGYESYDDALNHGQDLVAASNLMGPVKLGGGIQPPHSLNSAGMTATVTITLSPPIIVIGGGTISFGNSLSTAIIDGQTGLPMAAGIAVAGLYYSSDLNAVSNPNVARDDFELLAVRDITNGRFIGGTIYAPDAYPGQEVLIQVRVWSAAYGSYEEAFNNGAEVLGASGVIPFILGGGSLPTPPLGLNLKFSPRVRPWNG